MIIIAVNDVLSQKMWNCQWWCLHMPICYEPSLWSLTSTIKAQRLLPIANLEFWIGTTCLMFQFFLSFQPPLQWYQFRTKELDVAVTTEVKLLRQTSNALITIQTHWKSVQVSFEINFISVLHRIHWIWNCRHCIDPRYRLSHFTSHLGW